MAKGKIETNCGPATKKKELFSKISRRKKMPKKMWPLSSRAFSFITYSLVKVNFFAPTDRLSLYRNAGVNHPFMTFASLCVVLMKTDLLDANLVLPSVLGLCLTHFGGSHARSSDMRILYSSCFLLTYCMSCLCFKY